MHNLEPRWSVTALLLATAIGVGVVGCAATPAETAPSKSEQEPMQIAEVDDPYASSSLFDLGTVSDLAVRGTVTGYRAGVQIGRDTDAAYTVYTVSVTETVFGPATKTVNVALLTELGGGPVTIQGRPKVEEGNDALWILTRIAPEFGLDGYVLTSTGGLIPITDETLKSDSLTSGAVEAVERGLKSTVAELQAGYESVQ